MMSDGEPGALFSADRDLILHDEFANVLESDRSLVKFHAVVLRERVNQVRGCDRFCDAILPASALYQIVEQKGNHIIRLDEGSIRIDNAEAICVAIGCDSNVSARL